MHTTWKLFAAVALAIILAWIFPSQSGAAAYAVPAVLGAIFMLGMVFLRAVKRHEDLMNRVATELNKIRRVYHLGKNLGENPAHRGWFTELHGYVYGYLSAFDKKDFGQYAETNGEFRKLSYHLYSIEDLSSEKERVLYRELLEAAGETAAARQFIQELWNGSLAKSVWTMLFGITFLAAAVTISTVDDASRMAVGLTLAFLVVTYGLVRDVDSMKTVDGKRLSKRYVENLARLELKRHGKE